MKITVAKRYMMLPVCEQASTKRLLLLDNDKPVVELTARISTEPDYVMPYDMRCYIGKELDLCLEPEIDFVPSFSDEKEDAKNWKYRPVNHFTAEFGWINDPNGLVYYEGQYHLFYQHNPVDVVWGNMHWGHAVSTDLVHWHHEEEALFMDETGMMYSGSAVVDEKNLTGLKENDHAPLLLFYTAAGGKGIMDAGVWSTQRMAYSVDGGRTFRKYEKAIIETITHHNRDPKVVWCDELGKWLMALYLDGSTYRLFTSEDLLHWNELQDIELEEDNECPDIYPLECEGERYWVFSGAHDRYIIGKIENGLFVAKEETRRLHYGMKAYAAQTFFSTSDGRRIRFSWNQSDIPRMPFTGSMSTPHEMVLKRIDDRIKLCIVPCREFDSLHTDKICAEDELALQSKTNDISLWIPAGKDTMLTLFGLNLRVNGLKHRLEVPAHDRIDMPLYVKDGFYQLRLIQDIHSIEIYGNAGESTMCLAHISDTMLSRIVCQGAKIEAYGLKEIGIQ